MSDIDREEDILQVPCLNSTVESDTNGDSYEDSMNILEGTVNRKNHCNYHCSTCATIAVLVNNNNKKKLLVLEKI